MTFSRRERLLIFGAVAAVALLVGDRYVLTPMLTARDAVAARRDQLVVEMAEAGGLLERRLLLGRKWRAMLADGLQREPAMAESQLLRSLDRMAADAGVRLSTLRAERSTEAALLPEVTVYATGTGTMGTVARLLYSLQTCTIPARVRMLQLGSRREGTDELSVQMRVSTLYAPPNAPAGTDDSRVSTRGGRR